jgi:glyoxylase-like metal-dependent hydrolase (beta-lactamase superfamily II)
MPIAELADALPANQLHVVVFGPGYGESIAVHLPEGGWLITDSLAGRGEWVNFVPAIELLQAREEYAAAVLLTHPHDDHAGGLDRIVTRYARGPGWSGRSCSFSGRKYGSF